MVKTRETSKRVYLVGNVLKNMDSDKCPTKRTVLANFLYLRMEEKKSVRESLGEVIKNIEAIWQSLYKAVGVRRNSIKKTRKTSKCLGCCKQKQVEENDMPNSKRYKICCTFGGSF